jgi:nitroimidazol reductase NimA-like FMN-containing flavoprotein (pyridoxamine 5'-phosphate oxidase superfamily)
MSPEVSYGRIGKQYVAMPEAEVWRYIEAHDKMFVAFVREDGYPHLTPVNYVVRDRRLYFTSYGYKVKVRLAAAGGKVSCAWEEGHDYETFKGAVLWGRSRVLGDADLAAAVHRQIAERFATVTWEPARLPAEWKRMIAAQERPIIEITPERIASWDNSRLPEWPG